MVNVKNKTCIHQGCKTQPIFNVEGELERSLPERDKFFQDCSVDEPPTQLEENDAVGYYMQGVANEDLVVNLLPGQLGVLLTLQPSTKSYVRDEVVLSCFRESFFAF